MSHPFSLMLDQEPTQGHVFGNLSAKIGDEWVLIERRCYLCQSLPIDLLTHTGSLTECAGLGLP